VKKLLQYEPGRASIILPTYNGSKYLASAIESCLAQTYTNFELILVDDCSKDATPQIITDYVARDTRVRSIRHETNKYLPEGLNTGHRAARGEFLTWTSDDNLLRPNFLERMISFLQSNPAAGFVYSDYTEIDDDGHVLRRRVVTPPENLAWQSALGGSFLYRRTTFEKVGLYDPEMIMAEDYDYWLRCYLEVPMITLHEDLYQYRFHEGSLTETRKTAQAAAVERVLRKNLPLVRKAPRHMRAAGWLRVCGASGRRRDWGGCLNGFCRALYLSPITVVKSVFRKLSSSTEV
jgi:glycosyltransferase involved in cell wall biosynthesis